MQMTIITLLGFMILVALAAGGNGANGNKPVRLGHLKMWGNGWGFVAFILAILIMVNPEFLALGLLGDAAFFDVMVLVLSLQLRSGVFHVLHCVRSICSKVCSLVISGMRRDFSMMVLALVALTGAVLEIRQVVIKSFCQLENTSA